MNASDLVALRINGILIETARRTETITYGALGKETGLDPWRGLGRPLDQVIMLCILQRLPRLTSLVVYTARRPAGRCGPGYEIGLTRAGLAPSEGGEDEDRAACWAFFGARQEATR